jgi:hypothetical protein
MPWCSNGRRSAVQYFWSLYFEKRLWKAAYWGTPSLTWSQTMRSVPASLKSRPLNRNVWPSARVVVLKSDVLELT